MGTESIDIKLNALTGGFEKSMGGAMGQIDKLSAKIGISSKTMLAGAAAAAGLVAGVVALSIKVAATGDELLKMSEQTGLSVEKLSLLRFAAEQSDASMALLATGLKGLSSKMLDVQLGSQKTKDLFKAMDVSVETTSGALRPMEDVLLEISDVFSELGDGATKAALAQKIFGGAGLELIPLLSLGRDGIAQLTQKASELGLEFSTKSAEAASIYNDQIMLMGQRWQGLAETIGKVAIPALSGLMGWMDNVIEANIQFFSREFWEKDYQAEMEALLRLRESGKSLSLVKEKELDRYLAGLEEKRITEKKAAGALAEEKKSEIETDIEITNILEERIGLALKKKELDKKIADAEKKRLADLKEGNKQESDGIKVVILELQRQLKIKEDFFLFDRDYFDQYATLLRLQGRTTEEINAAIAKSVASRANANKATDKDETESYKVFQDAKEVAAQGVADSIKGLWGENAVSFDDVWRRSLDTFIDTMGQMVVEHGLSMTAVQIQSAAATAGMSLFIGALASAIGGGGDKGPSQMELAQEALNRHLEAFLDALRASIDAFESETSTALENLIRETGAASINFEELFEDINQLVINANRLQELLEDIDPFDFDPANAFERAQIGERMLQLQSSIIDTMDELKDGIREKYDLEKGLIEDIMGLLDTQQGFVKTLDDNIKDVSRSLLSPEDMFDAVLGDISALEALVAATTGQDQIDALGDLQKSYNDLFKVAQNLFSNDPDALENWQDFVVEGLEGIKDTGIDAYDRLIDLALEELDLTREGLMQSTNQTDLQTAMEEHLKLMADAVLDTLRLLDDIATAPTANLAGLVGLLADALAIIGIDTNLPTAAQGGLVTRTTKAIVHAGERIIPADQVSRLSGAAGGNTFVFPNAFPNVTDIRDLTINQVEELLKDTFLPAAERLGRSGYTWGMEKSANV